MRRKLISQPPQNLRLPGEMIGFANMAKDVGTGLNGAENSVKKHGLKEC
jgi:hypothetical protein